MNTNNPAPVYRYYAVDLMSNEILAEIPFQGVSWSRALKDAGTFEGRIPVIEATDYLSLYETTMPVVTAIFAVRNGICVWGGIIWAREYDAVNQVLNVSASEFTSYLYHRKIWKSWNHQQGASVIIESGSGTVAFDYGSNIVVKPGSTVNLEFYEPANFKYNGNYKVATSPAPDKNGFTIVGGKSTATISSLEVSNTVLSVYTEQRHGFQTGDSIEISGTTTYDGTYVITVPPGGGTNVFTVTTTEPDTPRISISGEASRAIPEGTYTRVTVTVRTDTYDYVRSLIDAAFTDFVGTEFPNVYIEPGISYSIPVESVALSGGLATITLEAPHQLSLGQAVQVQDIGPLFDGEVEVVGIPSDTQFRYQRNGTLATTPVSPVSANIVSAQVSNFEVTLTTSSAHGYLVGQNVEVFCGYDIDPSGVLLNGTFKITAVPSATTFKYAVLSRASIPETTFTQSTATVGADVEVVDSAKIASNVATITTKEAHGFSAGNSVTIANVDHIVPISQKSFDSTKSEATIVTAVPHQLQNGDSVVISGLKDAVQIVKKQIQSNVVTMTSAYPHNLKAGDVVEISNMVDEYTVTNKQLTSNVATLTTSSVHNLTAGNSVTVNGIVDEYAVTSRSLLDGLVTVNIANHNINVNDEVEVVGIPESATVSSKEIVNGIAILTFTDKHNFLETQEITVAGVGAPYNGDFTVLSFTDTRILYELPSDYANTNAAPVLSGGTVTSVDSIYNGIFRVAETTSGSISYYAAGVDTGSASVSGTVRAWSILNGTFSITATPTTTTFQYAKTGVNIASTAVPAPVDEEQIPATASIPSIHLGNRTLTSVSRNTFSFTQTVTNNIALTDAVGVALAESIFNGTRTVAQATSDSFKFTLVGVSNVLEESANFPGFVSANGIFNGTYTIASVPDSTSFTYAKTHVDVAQKIIYGLGEALVSPLAIVSTFGPYPGNANIGLEYSTQKYSGVDVEPISYRGFELTNLGEALNTYSDTIDGFDYRIDCFYDADTESFRKVLVLIPINFPDPPLPGEVSPLTRFGADRLIFEFPGGSITDLRIQESGENTSTRFFAQGENDLGPDVGPRMAIASAEDLLSGSTGRKWPLLDETEQVDGIDDETVLYAYARRYLSETRPPEAALTVSVNGSLDPVVGSYAPGDWCSLIINDRFFLMRLATGLEPRDSVFVRKIDSFRVTVPDGTTFPETVNLNLVAEWEVDKIG